MFTLRVCIYGVSWTIYKCKVFVSQVKIDKYSCEFGESRYLIVLFLFSVKKVYSFETPGIQPSIVLSPPPSTLRVPPF